MPTHPAKIIVSSVNNLECTGRGALPKMSLSCISIHVMFLIKKLSDISQYWNGNLTFFAGDVSCKYYETAGSPMIEQQDAFGGPFFKIVILRGWWCGIHIQIFVHRCHRWWAYILSSGIIKCLKIGPLSSQDVTEFCSPWPSKSPPYFQGCNQAIVDNRVPQK